MALITLTTQFRARIGSINILCVNRRVKLLLKVKVDITSKGGSQTF